MADIFDEYIDQYTMGAGGVYGVSLNFRKSNPKPVVPGSDLGTTEIGTIRMSLEHFKVMIFLMKRQMDEIESQFGTEIQLPIQVMNSLRIAPEDWQKFWQRS
jgi:hypothetical protein